MTRRIKKDYSKLSQEELIAEIQKLLEEKKYGLMWENKEEDVVKQCQKELPVLEEVKNKEILTDQSNPINLLIEGDNYHALSVLNYTHAKKVDVIYIDPPYNTGNKDFIFNDHYVDKEDTYRHSKWLSFMEKRLKLAKNLLKDDGVIFISIDDNEVAQLKLLCDEIFGENNFIAMLTIESGEVFGTKAAHVKKTFVKVKDYVLVYAKNKNLIDNKQPLYDEARELYDSHYNTVIENDLSKKSLFQSLKNVDWIKELFDENKLKINSENINHLMKISEKFKNYIFKELAEKLFADAPFNGDIDFSDKTPQTPFRFENKILFKTGTGSIRMYIPFSETLRQSDDFASRFTRTTIRGDLWKNFHFDMRNVQDEGDIDFKNGKKPVRLIKQLLKWYNNRSAIILDFFVGSGTTGHAVLELNKEDNGNRRFILCTNNENKICTDVCYPRIKKVIKGYKNLKGKKVDGLGGNLKYYKTSFVPKSRVSDDTKYNLVQRSTEMICMKEDTFEKVVDKKYIKIFKNINQYTAILFHLDYFNEFKKELRGLDKQIHIYVFSLTSDTYDEDFKDLKQKYDLCPIPESILEVFKRFGS